MCKNLINVFWSPKPQIADKNSKFYLKKVTNWNIFIKLKNSWDICGFLETDQLGI